MTWNIPTDITGPASLLAGVNSMLGNDLAVVMLMVTVFFITLAVSTFITDMDRSLLVASWFTFMTAAFSAVIFHADSRIVVPPIILLLFSIWLVRRDK